MTADTYTVSSPDALPAWLTPSHIVSVIGQPQVLICTNGTRIPMGVPLCTGCDAVVTDGNCASCNSEFDTGRPGWAMGGLR